MTKPFRRIGDFNTFIDGLNKPNRTSAPFYNDDANYNTNSKSYYDYLGRLQKLFETLSSRIWEYDEELAKRFEEWDALIERFPEDVEKLLIKWLDDGTLDDIINHNIFKDLNNDIDGLKILITELKKKDISQDTEISKVNNRVTQTRQDFDDRLDHMVSPSPIDVVENVTELNSKYPNGAKGVVVVKSDGYYYYYAGGKWNKGTEYVSSPYYKLVESNGDIISLNYDQKWIDNPDITTLKTGFYQAYLQDTLKNDNYPVAKNIPNINGAECLIKVFEHDNNGRKDFEIVVNYNNLTYSTSKDSEGRLLEWGVVQIERDSKPEQHYLLTYRSGAIRSLVATDPRNENNSLLIKITDLPTGFYYGQISDNNGLLDRNLPDDLIYGAYFTINVFKTEDNRMHIHLQDHTGKRLWIGTTYPNVEYVKWSRIDVETIEFDKEQHDFVFKANKVNSKKTFKNLIITDTHIEYLSPTQQIGRVNPLNLRDFYRVDNMLKHIDSTIHLGDWLDGNYPKKDSAYSLVKFNTEFYSKPNRYGIYGNHDYNPQWDGFAGNNAVNKFKPEYLFDKEEMKEYFTPFNQDYYFVDDEDKKIRMIYINNFDVSYMLNSEGKYYEDFQNVTGIGSEQIRWIVDTLNTVPTDYNVVVYAHNATDGVFSTNSQFRNGALLRKIYEAYQTKTALELYTTGIDETDPTYQYFKIEDNATFENSNGKILGVISGHRHLDETKSKNGIRYIGLLCGRAEGNGTSQPLRNYHTFERNCFSLLEFDLEKEQINLIRYGAGKDYTVKMFE